MKRTNALTIIVPAYQAEDSVSRLLASLLKWPGDDIEVIVINDGSTDRTEAVVSSIVANDSRVRLISQPNRGRSAARNAGISQARGEWVMFADSDDCYLDSWQDPVRDALSRDNALTVFSMKRSDGLNGFGGKVHASGDLPAAFLPASDVLNALVEGTFRTAIEFAGSFEWNSCWARLYRRDIVDKVAVTNGGDAFPVGLKFSEDRLFNIAYLNALGSDEVAFDNSPVYYWDLGLSSTVAKASPEDARSLIAFSEAARSMGEASGFSRDVPKIVAMEVSSQFRRSASLPPAQLRDASLAWQGVIDSGVLNECGSLLHEFIGGKAWAYKSSLDRLLAGKPLGALKRANAVAAAGSLLGKLRGSK